MLRTTDPHVNNPLRMKVSGLDRSTRRIQGRLSCVKGAKRRRLLAERIEHLTTCRNRMLQASQREEDALVDGVADALGISREDR